VLERGEAVASILLRVLLVADADQRLLEELDDRCDHLLLREPLPRQVLANALPNRAERVAERDHASVLGFVADLAPPRVVAVLLAPPRVPAGGLDVAALVGADPHVRPRRRNGQRPDPLQRGFVEDPLPVRSDVREPLAGSFAPD